MEKYMFILVQKRTLFLIFSHIITPKNKNKANENFFKNWNSLSNFAKLLFLVKLY